MIKINRSKFNVDKDKSKRTYNGIVFDSVLEMKYFRDVLCPKVESGDVVKYELQNHMNCNQSSVMTGSLFSQLSMWLTFLLYIKMDMKKLLTPKDVQIQSRY